MNKSWLCVAGMLIAPSSVLATEFNWNGFMTFAAGKVLTGSVNGTNELGEDCPCMISDFSQNGVLTRSFDFDDSKLGLQGTVQFNDSLSLTGQAVSRGSRDFKVNVEWVYASWQMDDNDTLQLGRKRLPLFYYSEQQDISFTYPWVHLPPQTYGWEAVNYNGVNWNHQWSSGDWSGIVNSFAGTETRTDNDYLKIYLDPSLEHGTRWDNIVGAEMTAAKDWFEGRLMLMRSENSSREPGEAWTDPVQQLLFGASIQADFGQWYASSELFFSDRTKSYGRDLAYSVLLGRRFGDLSLVFSHGMYQQKLNRDNPFELTDDSREQHRLNSLVARYELTASSAFKIQLDDWNDQSGSWFKSNYGNARALSLAYDMVF